MPDKSGGFRIASILPDVLLIAGWALVSYGAWVLHPASGAIVSGLLLLIAGIVSSRKAAN